MRTTVISNSIAGVREALRARPRRWLITGCAGFVGSNLLESLLELDQEVVGVDDFSTGHRRNLDEVVGGVSEVRASRFRLIEGDIRDLDVCHEAMSGIENVLHEAALGSVPRSINDPIATNDVNISGFLNILVAARDEKVRSFVYAGSSSTYGDHPALPKTEDRIGAPLSPYAVTKYVNELYAQVFGRVYGFGTIGLRYFNVFGRRQRSDSAYAAVIPKWAAAMINGSEVVINGDGETSRDFCYVQNVVDANILATAAEPRARNQVYNVALNKRTSLNDLFLQMVEALAVNGIEYAKRPVYHDFRGGDVRHSQADVTKAREMLGFSARYDLELGLRLAMPWYVKNAERAR